MNLSKPQRSVRNTRRLAAGLGFTLGALTCAVLVTYFTVPLRNYPGDSVDVILVLGSPTTSSGAMTPMQYARVLEGVREYQRGRAPWVLFTGGPAANRFREAETMRQGAIQMGLPANIALAESNSLDTWDNIRNSLVILQAHRWTRVEVISSREHLRRTALLLQHTDLHWCLHAAPVPLRPWWKTAFAFTTEAVATTIVRWFGLGSIPLLHAVTERVNSVILQLRIFWRDR